MVFYFLMARNKRYCRSLWINPSEEICSRLQVTNKRRGSRLQEDALTRWAPPELPPPATSFFLEREAQEIEVFKSHKLRACSDQGGRSCTWELGSWMERTPLPPPAALERPWSGAAERGVDCCSPSAERGLTRRAGGVGEGSGHHPCSSDTTLV